MKQTILKTFSLAVAMAILPAIGQGDMMANART